MAERVCVPIKTVNNEKWGQLNFFGTTHLICGEDFRPKNQNYTFAGGHRVRLYAVKNNVHWKIPAGTPLDISDVRVVDPPRRR
jgi:hypothetical protein